MLQIPNKYSVPKLVVASLLEERKLPNTGQACHDNCSAVFILLYLIANPTKDGKDLLLWK